LRGGDISFQMMAAEKLKERLLNLVRQEGTHKRFWLAEQRQRDDWYTCRRFLGYGGWLKEFYMLEEQLCTESERVPTTGSQ